MQVLAVCVILGLAPAGCGQAIGRGVVGPPTPVRTVAAPLPVPTQPRHPAPSPLPTWTPDLSGGPSPTPGIVLVPHSPHVDVGQTVPFTLYHHCGIDFEVDFDGSFWDAVHPEPRPAGLDDLSQDGTMTLLDPDHARFTWAGGTIDYTRHVGPKVVPGLCA
jgi:hypothetical protein